MSVSADLITRSEYEARHSELRTELIRLSTENDSHFQWVIAENEKMRKDVQNKFDILAAKVDSASVGVWKLIAASLLNFMAGGGLVVVLNMFHVFR